jgi:hypothetical protein
MNAAGQGYLRWYLAAAALLTLTLAVFNWAVDPLQIYRRAAYEPVFSENQRYQNPGLALHYDYEIAILGTSHAENFSPRQVERVLGAPAVKLAISGATAREQYLILDLAIGTGKLRRVLWGLDRLSFRKPAGAVSSREGDFPMHLYRRGLRTHPIYLLSLDTLGLSMKVLRGAGHRDLETLNAWHTLHRFGEDRVLADWRRRGEIVDRIHRDPTQRYASRSSQMQQSLRANVLSLVEAHPEIRFDFFFPPYSILSFLSDLRTWEGAVAERRAYKAFVVSSLAAYPNAHVYDFQGIERITHDLGNYKDLEHYRPEINDYIVESIAADRHRIDPDSLSEQLAQQAAQLERYRAEVCGSRGPRRELCPRIAR